MEMERAEAKNRAEAWAKKTEALATFVEETLEQNVKQSKDEELAGDGDSGRTAPTLRWRS